MNEVLADFLKERRRKVRKSQEEVGAELGTNQSQYSKWEYNGVLPKNRARLVKMAKALEVTTEELLEKAGVSASELYNLLPLIQTIAKSNCRLVTVEDLEFLQDTQSGLELPMTTEVVEQLLKLRASSK